MTQKDKRIPDNMRCPVCDGAGWTPHAASVEPPEPAKWIVCRECIGTGRTDSTGRKRQQPSEPPA
jgi:DnaJ-class molecular chaperone